MPASTADIIAHSVTEGDIVKLQGTGGAGVFQFQIFPQMNGGYTLPPSLPPYWSLQRDIILRSTILFEDFWAQAVAIACTKMSTLSFDIEGSVPRRVQRAQQMMLQWNGNEGYVASQERAVMDYTCTDNGEHHEIVRASGAAGSRVLGLVQLDSLRCIRTGDPDIPILYLSLDGKVHEMKWYQVISLASNPDSGAHWFGTGHCAAAKTYNQIYKQYAVETYLREKVTGGGATELELLGGVTHEKLEDGRRAAEQQKAQQQAIFYMGKILLPIKSDTGISKVTVPLKSVPDGFDRKTELDIALLSYANALGLVLTDLQPLSGQGLGTGAQSIVIEEKAQGREQAARRKKLIHLLNEMVMPDDVTISFRERDLRDEKSEADIKNTRASTRAAQIASQEITIAEARQLAVDADDLPKEFLERDVTEEEILFDEEKPEKLDDDAEESVTPLSDEDPEEDLDSDRDERSTNSEQPLEEEDEEDDRDEDE